MTTSRFTVPQLVERAGIAALNPMQRCMADTAADRIILISPTGTGKTLAFAIRMARALDAAPQEYTQAVVIAPSRELVLQICDVLRPLLQPLRTVALYGGHSVTDERNSLATPPDVIVATPGRLLDHLTRGRADFGHVTALVLDEYDKSLELGFYDEMKRIASHLPAACPLTVLTSATRLNEMPDFLHLADAELFAFGTDASPRRNTRIARVDSPVRDKLDTLVRLLRSLDNGRYIVFVNHREAAERVWQRLVAEHLPAGLYHGGLDQMMRRRAVDFFANGTTPVLVSTDLGSRGLDIDDVRGVIHYHLPGDAQAWTHRNGRTARMGASGNAYVIIGPDEDIPDYVNVDYDFRPSGESDDPLAPMARTIYVDRGKREKVSRGDIVGYLIQQGGMTADKIGRIVLDDHSALVAVAPDTDVDALCAHLRPVPLKGKRVRLSPVR